jgi:hypothetical protein
MKKVFNTSEVPHVWNSQTQNEGRNSGRNLYFEGKTIYSYGGHFPIASISEQDNNIVYFTTRTYSNTTAKYIGSVRYACNDKNKIYCNDPKQALLGIHRENIQDFESKAKTSALKLPKSKKPEIYLNEISEQRNLLNKYAEHFKIDLNKFTLVYVNIMSKDGGILATEQELKAIEAAKIKKAKEQKKQHALQLKEFRNFERQILWVHDGFDYLRFNPKLNRLETSQNVQIPLESGKRLYKNVIKTIKTGECTVCGQSFLDRYEIKEINKDYIVIGCHKISIKEVQMLATQLEW